jgi:hypothetical protein
VCHRQRDRSGGSFDAVAVEENALDALRSDVHTDGERHDDLRMCTTATARFALSERTVFIGSGDLVSSTVASISNLTAADITVSHLMTSVNRCDAFYENRRSSPRDFHFICRVKNPRH